MTTRTITLFTGAVILLALSHRAGALEDLKEEHLDVVSLEGLGHMVGQEAAPQQVTPQPQSTPSAPRHSLHPDVAHSDDNIERSVMAPPAVVVSDFVRTNDAAGRKYADINILMDRSKDRSTSTNDGESFRMDLSTLIESTAVINARHRPEDTASRGSYYVNQLEVNSTIVINPK